MFGYTKHLGSIPFLSAVAVSLDCSYLFIVCCTFESFCIFCCAIEFCSGQILPYVLVYHNRSISLFCLCFVFQFIRAFLHFNFMLIPFFLLSIFLLFLLLLVNALLINLLLTFIFSAFFIFLCLLPTSFVSFQNDILDNISCFCLKSSFCVKSTRRLSSFLLGLFLNFLYKITFLS